MGRLKTRLKKLEKVSGGDWEAWLKQASPEELEAELKSILGLPEQASWEDIDIQFKKLCGLPEDIELTEYVLANLEAELRRSPNFG